MQVYLRTVFVVTGIDAGGCDTGDIIAVCTSSKKADEIKTLGYSGYAHITKRKAIVAQFTKEDAASLMNPEHLPPEKVYLIDEYNDDPIKCDVDFPNHQKRLKKEALEKLSPEQIEALKELGLD